MVHGIWRTVCLVAAFSILVAAVVLSGAGPVELGPSATNRRVAALLESSQASPSAADLAEAERLTRASLFWSPTAPGLWARLAYIQALRHGRIDAEASRLLLRSYKLAPVDPGLGPWRVNLVFGRWSDCSPALRAAAAAEAAALYQRLDPALRAERLAAVRDPAGHFALSLVLGSSQTADGATKP